LWVRAPPNPNISLAIETPQSLSGSYSAGGRAQSIDQVHTAVHCNLLLFFWVTLADLTFLTAICCTSRCFITLLAGSKSYYCWKEGAEKQLPLDQTRKFKVFKREKITLTIGDRVRFTKNVKHRGKFLNNELRTVVGIDEGKIIFDKGDIVRNRAALHLEQGIDVTSHASQAKTVDQVISSGVD
jgi:hypothetical protein